MPPGISILYPIAMVWALVRSAKPLQTLLWMVVSWVAALCLILALGEFLSLSTGNSNAGAAFAALFTIPSFLVPAVVGVVHARKHRKGAVHGERQDNVPSFVDARPKKGVVYTESELEAMKGTEGVRGQPD